MSRRIGLAEILEMDEKELLEYIMGECIERGIDFDPDMLDSSGKQALYDFDPDMLDSSGKQALYDFIVDNIEPKWQAELHSECQLAPGCNMFPNAQTDEDLEEEMEHIASRD